VKYLGFASIGALVWCFVFVTIGRFVGSNWTVIHGFVKRNIAHSITIVALIVVIIVIILMSRRKKAV
jgi:membrane protein DedA with SNARE-associated domain